jgi:dolichol-phosphate mannosyltransferase
MITYTRSKVKRLLKIDFIRFCIVGGTGFVINFILLVAFTRFLGLSTVVAQFIGAEVALFSNFMMHHHWTYKSKNVKKSFKSLLIQFHATTWPAILGSTFMVSASVGILHLSKFVALMISSAVSLLWNFFWSKYVIWRGVTQQQIEDIAQ